MTTKLSKAAVSSAIEAALPVGHPIAGPNQKLQETLAPGQAWSQIFHLTSTKSVKTLGDDGEDRLQAITQVNFNTSLHSGSEAVDNLSELLLSYFTAGKVLVYNDQAVHVTGCNSIPGREVDQQYRVSVEIRWYSDFKR